MTSDAIGQELPVEPSGSIDYVGYLYLILMVVIGSSTAASAKYAVKELPLGILPLARFGVAGLCVLPLALRSGRFVKMLREDFPRVAIAGALCVPINQTFFLGGARLAPTSHVALIYATCPLVVLLLATLLGQERFVPSRALAVLASVLGLVLVAYHGGSLGADTLRGDLLLVGAVIAWGAYLTANKPLIARHGSIPALAGTFLIGSLFDLPLAIATTSGMSTLSTVSNVAWLGLAHLSLIVTVMGLAFQNQALRRFDATQVATFGNAAPVLTIVWGVWLLGEEFTTPLAVGAALTFGGIIATSLVKPTFAKVEVEA